MIKVVKTYTGNSLPFLPIDHIFVFIDFNLSAFFVDPYKLMIDKFWLTIFNVIHALVNLNNIYQFPVSSTNIYIKVRAQIYTPEYINRLTGQNHKHLSTTKLTFISVTIIIEILNKNNSNNNGNNTNNNLKK